MEWFTQGHWFGNGWLLAALVWVFLFAGVMNVVRAPQLARQDNDQLSAGRQIRN